MLSSCRNIKKYINYMKMASKRKINSDNEEKTEKPEAPKKSKHWSLGLLDTMNDPNQQIKSDDKIIVIKDKYAKAKFHYLVLPKENIADLKQLTKDHLELLEHMENIGNELVKEHDGHNFKLGYHAQPSMQRLHLHVISDDYDSPALKTKKHWNSYTTDFFLNSEDVRKSLEKNGHVDLPSEEKIKEYLNTSLRCHRCGMDMKHMPALKKHIVDC